MARGHGHHHDHGHDHELGGLRPGGRDKPVAYPLRRLAALGPFHNHDAADLVDTNLVTNSEGMRALAISLGGLVLTAGLQLVILLLSGSVALLADTIHNFADALTAIPLGIAFWLGRRPTNRRYTYGYGRSEDLAGVVVVLAVAASAVVAGYEAINRLIHPTHVSHIGWVAAAGVIGFLGNEVVARYRITVGRRIGSAALEADGYHARTDGWASLGVVAGAAGVALGWSAADAAFGLVITTPILLVAVRSAREMFRRLMDAVDPKLVDQMEAVLNSTPGVMSVDAVHLRWIGHQLHGEADITADAGLTLPAAHEVAEEAKHCLLHQVHRLSSATIHVSPVMTGNRDPHALTAHHTIARH